MIQTLSVAVLSLLSSANSSCPNGHPSVAAEYQSRSVFIGTVISERHEPETKIWDQEGTTYVVRVDERLSGQFPRKVQLFSENSSGRFPMDVGTKYLLFAYSERGRTVVDNCGNSEVYSNSSPALREVRQLRTARRKRS